MKPAAAPSAPTMTLPAPREDVPSRRRGRVQRAMWVLFLFVDAPLLLAVALGLAAAYLHPQTFWWAQLLGIALPYLTWGLGLAAVIPLLVRRWGWFMIHLILLGAVAWRVAPPERFATPPASAESDLVLMSFNVPRSGPSGAALADSLVGLVRAEGPDVLALQEVWAQPNGAPLRDAIHVEAVVDRLPYALAAPPYMDPIGEQALRPVLVPLLVRKDVGGVVATDGFRVIDQQALLLEEGAEDYAVSHAVRTRFRWREREGVLYNVHLRSFGEAKPWEDRIRFFEPSTWLPYLRRYRDTFRARAAETELIADRIAGETLPVIVAGDFNGTSDNWTYRTLRGARQDAFVSAGSGAGYTYRSDKPFVRIDFVLVDDAWEVTGAETPRVGFSDHLPLVVRLRWDEAAQ